MRVARQKEKTIEKIYSRIQRVNIEARRKKNCSQSMKLVIHQTNDDQGLIAGNLSSRLNFTLATGGIRKEIFNYALPIETPAAERERRQKPLHFN